MLRKSSVYNSTSRQQCSLLDKMYIETVSIHSKPFSKYKFCTMKLYTSIINANINFFSNIELIILSKTCIFMIVFVLKFSCIFYKYKIKRTLAIFYLWLFPQTTVCIREPIRELVGSIRQYVSGSPSSSKSEIIRDNAGLKKKTQKCSVINLPIIKWRSQKGCLCSCARSCSICVMA